MRIEKHQIMLTEHTMFVSRISEDAEGTAPIEAVSECFRQ